MGDKATLLLVIRAGRLALALGFALLMGCAKEAPNRVDAGRYDAFFLWAGVRPPAVLDRARTIYILDGEVRAGDNTRIVPLRPEAPRVRNAEVWLTLRVERIDWAEPVFRQLLVDAAKWEGAGARLAGIQIDFDARTRRLDGYMRFLAALRQRLPAKYRLSVTGLMDWSANGDAAQLAGLHGVVDEVVVQTYQGRRTIPGYEGYLASLGRLPIPYRVGLVQGGEWHAPAKMEADPNFRGYVVFLLPRP
jgi:hypothetical protein